MLPLGPSGHCLTSFFSSSCRTGISLEILLILYTIHILYSKLSYKCFGVSLCFEFWLNMVEWTICLWLLSLLCFCIFGFCCSICSILLSMPGISSILSNPCSGIRSICTSTIRLLKCRWISLMSVLWNIVKFEISIMNIWNMKVSFCNECKICLPCSIAMKYYTNRAALCGRKSSFKDWKRQKNEIIQNSGSIRIYHLRLTL